MVTYPSPNATGANAPRLPRPSTSALAPEIAALRARLVALRTLLERLAPGEESGQ